MTFKLSAADANAWMRETFGDRAQRGEAMQEILLMEPGRCEMRMETGPHNIRPGGFISGPTQMQLADSAAYFAVMTHTGLLPMALTSQLNISFLRPCLGDALLATGRVLKSGRTLFVLEVELRGEGAEKPSSHAIVTYALPKD